MSHCRLRRNESWRWKHSAALFPHPWKRRGQSVYCDLSFLKQWQLWENNVWKIVDVVFLAAVHAVILTSMFVLLWRYMALGVYLWFGTCSFSVLVCTLEEGGSTGLPPLWQRRFIAIMIVITATIRCFWLGRQKGCAISRHEDHLDSICIFYKYGKCVCVRVCVREEARIIKNKQILCHLLHEIFKMLCWFLWPIKLVIFMSDRCTFCVFLSVSVAVFP